MQVAIKSGTGTLWMKRGERRRTSLSCNLSLAPGFSPVGAGDAAPSRFNGFVGCGKRLKPFPFSPRTIHPAEAGC